MIKATDLRIGNWVRLHDPRKERRTGTERVWGRLLLALEQNDPEDDIITRNVEPIPITPEILTKCGLVERYVKGEWSWSQGGKWQGFTEGYLKEDGYHYLGDYPPIHYLHQLQNLYFAITGEELEVRL